VAAQPVVVTIARAAEMPGEQELASLLQPEDGCRCVHDSDGRDI
jgi:hypothetical protein